jgi:hypothetical protein
LPAPQIPSPAGGMLIIPPSLDGRKVAIDDALPDDPEPCRF